ncbi:hypothetical protein [Paracoccus sp. (in: a-proteobacteria)]|uniref:hypothetical protein n=1 Tax=Paracoccus sp. TaxID=267 RepID=UPI0026DFBF73|nr:hypothetical protein [Paracoccus sp. (in: a-proteobacteria)]MDO5646579.1 hypothetical protein [Paracoccus sp. (in: a-proteobacteria)]
MSDRMLTGQLECHITGVGDLEAVGEMTVTAASASPDGKAQTGALMWFADILATCLVLGDAGVPGDSDDFPAAQILNACRTSVPAIGRITGKCEWITRDGSLTMLRTRLVDDNGELLFEMTSAYGRS